MLTASQKVTAEFLQHRPCAGGEPRVGAVLWVRREARGQGGGCSAVQGSSATPSNPRHSSTLCPRETARQRGAPSSTSTGRGWLSPPGRRVILLYNPSLSPSPGPVVGDQHREESL